MSCQTPSKSHSPAILPAPCLSLPTCGHYPSLPGPHAQPASPYPPAPPSSCITLSDTYLLGSPCNKTGHTSSASPRHSRTGQECCYPGPGPRGAAAAAAGGAREPGGHVLLTPVWLPQEATSPSQAPPPFQSPNICLLSNSLLGIMGRPRGGVGEQLPSLSPTDSAYELQIPPPPCQSSAHFPYSHRDWATMGPIHIFCDAEAPRPLFPQRGRARFLLTEGHARTSN